MAEEIGSTWYKSQPSHLFFFMGDILLCKYTQAEPPGRGPFLHSPVNGIHQKLLRGDLTPRKSAN